MRMVPTSTLALLLALGCAAPTPRPAAEAAADSTPPRLENRVWARLDSAGVPTGALYTFLGEGSLVIASPTGTPMVGTWSRNGDSMVLVEEGVGYQTDIVRLDPGELLLRSHNPGGTIEIRLVPADSTHP